MPSDLNYFTEMNLNKASLFEFYEKLPGHLQGKFKACVHAGIKTDNVLQGYRGPSDFCNNGSGDSGTLPASNGIQEIRFWWGFNKVSVPIVGPIFFTLGRLVQTAVGELEWSSLYFDSKTGECLSHDKDELAEKLKDIGRRLHEEGKYSEAIEYYKNASKNATSGWSIAGSENDIYAAVIEGDEFFEQGNYIEACEKYKKAHEKCAETSQCKIYKNNRDKAQFEIDAKNLSSQADNLFQQGKYSEAQSKYQEAYDKSQISKEKNIYINNKNKIQTISNKLSILNHLWVEAWNTENDIETDQCEKAKEMFQWILTEANDNIKLFPGVPKFEQYKTLAGLKIEGNEIFNQGLASQQNGIALFEAGQELKLEEKYELANEKFKEAKKSFQLALEKFETGSKSDQRFLSCVEFVREQMNEVNQSLEINHHRVLSEGLDNLNINISSDNQSDVPASVIDETQRRDNLSAQI